MKTRLALAGTFRDREAASLLFLAFSVRPRPARGIFRVDCGIGARADKIGATALGEACPGSKDSMRFRGRPSPLRHVRLVTRQTRPSVHAKRAES